MANVKRFFSTLIFPCKSNNKIFHGYFHIYNILL